MQLKIATYNAGLLRIFGRDFVPHVKKRLPHLSAVLRDADADVVCLQEVFAAKHWERLSDELSDVYPHALMAERKRPFFYPGLCILSKYPVENAEFRRFKKHKDVEALSGHGFLAADIVTPKGTVALVNTHLSSGGWRHYRKAAPKTEAVQQKQLAELFAAVDRNTVLIGDFNTGPETKNPETYRGIIAAGWVDAAASTKTLLGPTLSPENTLRTRYRQKWSDRIDHVFFHAQSGTTARFARLFGNGLISDKKIHPSDHYGLAVDLTFGR